MKNNNSFLENKPERLFVVLQIIEKCNLRCKYCYIQKRSNVKMPLSVAYRSVDFFSDLYVKGIYDNVTICFHGGEPLLIFDYVKRIIEYAQKRGIDKFVIGTNGIIFNKKIINFMINNNISPTFSLDGIPIAHNANRIFYNGKGSWNKANKALDLFNPSSKFWRDKYIPDPFRVRVSFTPETAYFLSRSIIYLASKSNSSDFFINLMPANPHSSLWGKMYESGRLHNVLRGEFRKIANFYIRRLKKGSKFNLCINECLTPDWSNFSNSRGLYEVPSCGLGTRILGVGLNGTIFPCHLFAANYKENKKFCLGDVFNGMVHPEIINYFSTNKNNIAFSCPYWNYLASGSYFMPAKVFQVLYQAWKEAVLYIRSAS